MALESDWLKPPRRLLLFLFTLTLVSVSSLLWFGWKLLEQERLVEAQRGQERLEQAADRIAASLRRTIFETTARLTTWKPGQPSQFPFKPELLLQIRSGHLTVEPAGILLYYPTEVIPEAPEPLFTQAEMFEFAQDQPLEALRLYRQLAANPNSAIRAGALIRQARVLRRLNRMAEATPLYHQLATINDATVAGIPADLVAISELAALTKSGTRQLQHDLSTGRWALTRGQFFTIGRKQQKRRNCRSPPRHFPTPCTSSTTAPAKPPFGYTGNRCWSSTPGLLKANPCYSPAPPHSSSTRTLSSQSSMPKAASSLVFAMLVRAPLSALRLKANCPGLSISPLHHRNRVRI